MVFVVILAITGSFWLLLCLLRRVAAVGGIVLVGRGIGLNFAISVRGSEVSNPLLEYGRHFHAGGLHFRDSSIGPGG